LKKYSLVKQENCHHYQNRGADRLIYVKKWGKKGRDTNKANRGAPQWQKKTNRP